MLTRRTNLLLSEEDYLSLTTLSREKKKTMGDLIRYAVKKTYKTEKGLTATQRAFRDIRQATKNMDFSGIDYKDLINYGRKY